MAVQYQTTGAHLTGGSGTSGAVPVPSGVAAGSYIEVHFAKENADTITAPSGFTLMPGMPVTTSGGSSSRHMWHYVYWKRATGADSGSYTFTWANSTWRTGYAIRYSGVLVSGTPYDPSTNGAGKTSDSTTTPAVSITTSGPDRLVVWDGAGWHDAALFTPPTGYTERADGTGIQPTTATLLLTSAGGTGSLTSTSDTSTTLTAYLYALIPEPTQTIVDAPIVDITVQSVDPTVELVKAVTADIVDVTITPIVPEKLTKVANLPASTVVDITVEPTLTTSARVVDAKDTVDITVTPLEATSSGEAGIVDIRVEPINPTVGRTVNVSAAQAGIPQAPWIPNTRFLAQSILTGEFLHFDLEISGPTITPTLSGPQIISGSFNPEIRELRDVGLEPWATWIHVEDSGMIIASGILQPTSVDREGEALSLEALGPSAYPIDMPFMGELSLIQEDPANIVRRIWAHLQGYPDGNLGVVVRGTTPLRIGKPRPPETPEGEEDTNPDDDQDKPYELFWWEAPDCGDEINKLISSTPMDFVERQMWNADKTDVLHFIDLGYPRIGRRRTDLMFQEGVNLTVGLGPAEDPDMYASQIFYYGSGEGRDVIRGYAGKANPISRSSRVRRARVLTDNMTNNTARANALARVEFERRMALIEIGEIEIDGRDSAAPLGSFLEGDDIFVEADVPWYGTVRQWERILSFTYSPDTESIGIQVRRSETFNYGAPSTFEEGL